MNQLKFHVIIVSFNCMFLSVTLLQTPAEQAKVRMHMVLQAAGEYMIILFLFLSVSVVQNKCLTLANCGLSLIQGC